jgi:hypothetical protein
VGKGRKYRSNVKSRRNAYWKSIVLKNKGVFIVEKLAENLLESLAFELEIELIALLKSKGIKISNSTDGGEGSNGSPRPKSHEWRKKISDTSPLKISVFQFSKEGELLGSFDSIADAAKNLGICSSAITKCCKRKPKFLTVGGFIWRYKDDVDHNLTYKPNISRCVTVSQYSEKEEHIRDYSSASEAAKSLGICGSSIIKTCKGKNKTCGGFIWKYRQAN